MTAPTPYVSAIHVYPVKSLRGMSLDAATVGGHGLEHDRLWMVVDETGAFLTQRKLPQMCRIASSIEGGSLILTSNGARSIEVPVEGVPGEEFDVTVWRHTGRAVDQGDEVAHWLGNRIGVGCRLMRIADDHVREAKSGHAQVGFADAYPFLVISQASLDDLNGRLFEPLPMNRFRPNIVVDGVVPYAEDTWRRAAIGEVVLGGGEPCERCAVTTTDQNTGERGVEPLRTLAEYRQTPNGGVVFGRNFVHTSPGGTIRVGDPVLPRP